MKRMLKRLFTGFVMIGILIGSVSCSRNIEDYKDRIEIICTLFSLKIEDELVKGVIGFGTNQTYKQLHNFLQGISHLSTIKYFD